MVKKKSNKITIRMIFDLNKSEIDKLKAIELKFETLMAYSKTECLKCGRCDYRGSTLKSLSLHHVDGKGYEHREVLFGHDPKHQARGGSPFYAKLKSLGFPTDRPIEVRCANCQAEEETPQEVQDYHNRRRQETAKETRRLKQCLNEQSIKSQSIFTISRIPLEVLSMMEDTTSSNLIGKGFQASSAVGSL